MLTYESEPDNFQAQLKKIRTNLKTAQKERADYLAGWQRAKADLINNRRILSQQQEQAVKFANEQLIASLLPVLDSLDQAEKAKANKHLQALQAQLEAILKTYGLAMILPKLGQDFDVSQHEAVGQVKGKGKNNTIAGVERIGYRLHNKTLRPAKVRVNI